MKLSAETGVVISKAALEAHFTVTLSRSKTRAGPTGRTPAVTELRRASYCRRERPVAGEHPPGP